MPDIDSLPPPYSPPPSRLANNENRHSPSPRASNASLAAAATINASIQHEDSQRSNTVLTRDRFNPSTYPSQNERRRSSAFFSSYDPTLPGPGELQTGDLRPQNGDLPSPRMSFGGTRTSSPHGSGSPTFPPPRYRERTPSLGEIHQQLEQEQEAQVIRLLAMIRQSQAELQVIREQAVMGTNVALSAAGDITPPLFHAHVNQAHQANLPPGGTLPRASSPAPIRGSLELSRQSSYRSRTSSRTESPFRTVSTGALGQHDDIYSDGRRQALINENAYYVAETQNLTRENQMLRQRIRELERQLNDNNSGTTNSPTIPSNLSGPPIEAGHAEAVLAAENGEKED